MIRPYHQRSSSSSATDRQAPAEPATIDPTKPSQDFFGLIFGAIGCLPSSAPAAYPPVSEQITTMRNVSTRAAPSAGTTSMVAKAMHSGIQHSTSIEAPTSRTNPPAPRRMRHRKQPSTVTSSAPRMPSVPNGHASQIIAWPPMSTGTRESRIPAARCRAPKSSHVPMTAADREDRRSRSAARSAARSGRRRPSRARRRWRRAGCGRRGSCASAASSGGTSAGSDVVGRDVVGRDVVLGLDGAGRGRVRRGCRGLGGGGPSGPRRGGGRRQTSRSSASLFFTRSSTCAT